MRAEEGDQARGAAGEGGGEREKAPRQASRTSGRGPRPNDQINLTDEESRIMPVTGGGFDQCYNAQAAVAAGSLLVVASAVSQAPNDKQQLDGPEIKLGLRAESRAAQSHGRAIVDGDAFLFPQD